MGEQIIVGADAPDFVLKDQNEKEIKLSELRGKRVLISMHPLAWTSVCRDQMLSLEANQDEFQKLNTVALGLSVDSVPCKNAWAKDIGIERTSLLSDFWPHGGTADTMGLFISEKGITNRVNVIIDESGKVVFVKVYPIPQLPDINEIIEELRKLG